MTKKELRERCEFIRSGIPAEEKIILDRLIERNLFEWPVFQKTKYFSCYISFRSEIDTNSIMEKAIDMGKTVVVPKINTGTKKMNFYIINDTKNCLTEGAYGILEPLDSCKEADYGKLDLIIAPGLAFTLRGGRLGYGGGYYDRFLGSHSNMHSCVLTYDCLILDSLPVKENDIPVDYLISESGVKVTENERHGRRV
ncbi:MAG: 5-formyltetrahydrofolate cyclo-ligase [Spirochaetota bacterium]|nr:MAG: 5-formyltetrahydrofolate cyclo-ligase [Spirochaetota bacterium]